MFKALGFLFAPAGLLFLNLMQSLLLLNKLVVFVATGDAAFDGLGSEWATSRWSGPGRC